MKLLRRLLPGSLLLAVLPGCAVVPVDPVAYGPPAVVVAPAYAYGYYGYGRPYYFGRSYRYYGRNSYRGYHR